MPVRLTWEDNNPNEEAHEVYRSDQPMDPDNMPPPLAVLGPNAVQYDDGTAEDNETYFYRVAAVRNGVRAYSGELEVLVDPSGIDPGDPGDPGGSDDFTNAQPGDLIGGGVYAGIDTIGGVDYHIVAGLAESEEDGLQWKTSRTTTAGTGSASDGLANTLAMEAAGLASHPAAAHCLAYTGGGHNDWHMPARSQITLMYNNLRTHAEFATNVSSANYTWASTEYSSSYAWARRFSDGSEDGSTKDITLRRVRPVRRVAV